MNRLIQKQMWEEIKATLAFSHILCFVCHEPMYYGKSLLLQVGERPVFSCRCPDKIAIEYRAKEGEPTRKVCATCQKPVASEVRKESATRFRCTCGHADIVLDSMIESTVKI